MNNPLESLPKTVLIGILLTIIMVLLINGYQKIFAGRPSTCRFFPSCSSYAIESFEKKGFFKGFFLSVKRILRCNPWGGYGMDYVPENKRRINV